MAAALEAEAQADACRIALADAEQQRSYTRVVSPMDGVVSALNVQKGTIIASGINNVGGGTTVMTLSDLSRIFVVASVDESDIGKVAVGQPVTVTADAFPGKRFDGRVVQLAVRGVNSSNVVTFDVKIEVLDGGQGASAGAGEHGSRREGGPDPRGASRHPGSPDSGSAAEGRRRAGESGGAEAPSGAGASPKSLLKPEMTANVEIVAAERTGVLTVPAEAVARQGGRHVVEVVRAGGARETRDVEVGISDGLKTEVKSGLSEGEAVVLKKNAADSRWKAEQGGPRPPMMMGGGRRH